MNNKTILRVAMLAGVLSVGLSSLHAAPATLQFKDGRNVKAFNIKSETVSGIDWDQERNRPGVRAKLWDLEDVRYDGNQMDTYNGLTRRLKAGRGVQLLKDAQSYLDQKEPSPGFSKTEWDNIVVRACEYFVAQAEGLNGNTDEAIKKLEAYLKKCEANLTDENVLRSVTFNSKVSGKAVTNAGGLHRFYLDALESLGGYYIKKKDAKSASEKAFKPLAELCKALSTSGRDGEYFNWSMRALGVAAREAEAAKDFKGARESYELLMTTALERSGGQQTRASREAQLKVGFMLIEEGNLGDASTRFLDATRSWERAHVSADVIKSGRMPPPPANDWINPDVAYLAAGSYLGQGHVEAAKARRSKNVVDWTKAYQNYSMSLSIFIADDEIRGYALLGAAVACSELAELKKGKASEASNYATLAEAYSAELTSLHPKGRAAEDDALITVAERVKKYKKTK